MEVKCPWCGVEHNTQTFAIGNPEEDGSEPKPDDGSFSLCVDCEMFAVFEGAALRKPNDEETLELATNPDFNKCLVALRKTKAKLGKWK